ncbi:MAG: 2-amino-4-hydroxy-6-hydroxymethyldihydropteridine diphosphokinase [Bacteroides sp.]|nr:2-amino-4-hydroxy-6-hydroxymethyldihydropteridine diphosphokinase [Bacteroides sp.]
MSVTEYVFSLGSDWGNRAEAVKSALDWLSSFLEGFECSDIYETPPVGHKGSNYINAVAKGNSAIEPREMERMCKQYELEHGRDTDARKEKRVPIDIDIVVANGKVLRKKDYACDFFKIGYSQLPHERHHFMRPNLHIHSHVPIKGIMTFIKNWTLPLAIIMGIAAYFLYVNIPWLDSTHAAANRIVGIVQPLLIFGMLFLTFLSIGPKDLRLTKWHLWNVLIQIGLFGGFAYVLTLMENEGWRIILESCMLCLLCPTATAAAVVTRKLGGSAADITAYTMLINLAIAVTAPALLPIAHPHEGMTFLPTFLMIIGKVFPLLICPLLLAWGIRAFIPKLQKFLIQFKDLPFYMWAVALSIAIAVTVKAIVHSSVPAIYLIGIMIVTIVCCVLQFFLGKLIGGKYGQTIEGGQSLGQKNTVFIIWLGYTFLSPVTAVAGGFYSIWHNIFNSYQLYRHRKK